MAALLPAPAKCIDLAKVAADGGKLTIGITAYALPGGSFSRVSVSAPGQSPEAVKCLQSMVEHGSIAPDVPNAPRAIQASVPVEVVAQAQTAPARPTPPPLPSNIARPVPGEIARPDGNTIAQPSQ